MLGVMTMATLSKSQIKKNEEAAIQVIATLGIEDMHLSPENRRNLLRLAHGETTTEELLAEFKQKYAR